MRIFDYIGLGLFILSIVSVVFWSPRQYSIPHDLSNAMDKVSESKIEIYKKLPFREDLATEGKLDIKDKLEDSYRNSMTQNYDTYEKMVQKEDPNVDEETIYENQNHEALDSSNTIDTSFTNLKNRTSSQIIESYKETIQSNDQIGIQ
jgi:hypothetical protein